ncbi:MAG: ATP-binding cassette domain-containing protein [Candidatus Helarchaeota archaeon]
MSENKLENVIVAENLTKVFRIKKKSNFFRDLIFPRYDSFAAVDKLNLKIKKGEIFGLLGPNGAGKTTTVEMICGLLYPTQGTVLINGKDIQKNSHLINRLGVMFSNKMLYYRLTGYHNLKFFSKLYRIQNYDERIKELAELLGLTNWLNTYVEYYSLGMQTKLAIARTLLHDPDILLLDEPTLGLDVMNANFIRKLLRTLNKTILITTHYINEAEFLCDRIGFLFEGKLFKIDNPTNLKNIARKKPIIHVKTIRSLKMFIDEMSIEASIKEINKINDNEISIILNNVKSIPNLIKQLSDYEIESINQEISSLEDIFIQLIDQMKVS